MDEERGSQGRVKNVGGRFTLAMQKRRHAGGGIMAHYKLNWVRVSLHYLNFPNGTARSLGLRNCNGLTLIELLITVSIVATLAGIAAPIFGTYIDKARSQRAISDIRTTLQVGITVYEFTNDMLPVSLNDINSGVILDPWGNTYQFLNFAASGSSWKGKARKDRFLVPLNSDYDLYSMGKDGRSVSPLTSRLSLDDIIRANDGAYVGRASDY